MEAGESKSLEYTPTWIVALVCSLIILISLFAERGLHQLGKLLKHKRQDALFEALEKLKEELMLLGFISLMLTVLQNPISRICAPTDILTKMLPCKIPHDQSSAAPAEEYRKQFLHHHHPVVIINSQRHLLETNQNHCPKGQDPLVSVEALHQLHIFIFVLAVVHVVFCVSTMVLGGFRIRQWRKWEESIKKGRGRGLVSQHSQESRHHHEIFKQRAAGYLRNTTIFCWMISFFKQFYNSVTKSDYIAMRQGFIKTHCPRLQDFDFHKYMMRTLEVDFKKVVGISFSLWAFVVVFLLLNVEGWHTYFWLSFLPLILLLLVGAKLEYIIMRLAQEASQNDQVDRVVKPSDEHFWFGRPGIVLYLIHFILFQNSFEIAFFFWILTTYGFHSCIMEKFQYFIPRLFIGVVVQVLCSYSTLPLYALVTQMGSKFKQGMFDEHVHQFLTGWVASVRDRSPNPSRTRGSSSSTTRNNNNSNNINKVVKSSFDVETPSHDNSVVSVEANIHSVTSGMILP